MKVLSSCHVSFPSFINALQSLVLFACFCASFELLRIEAKHRLMIVMKFILRRWLD